MRTTVLGTGLVALVALGWLGACGGNVVVDGGSGGAGAGMSSGAGRPTAVVTSATSSGTGGGETGLCESVCNFLSSQCGEADCLPGCLQAASTNPRCRPQFVALVRCYKENLTSCEDPVECAPQADEYVRCVGDGQCSMAECFDSNDGTCGCKGACRGLDLAVECSKQRNTSTCNCFRDGQVIGTCEDFGAACSIEEGCCASLFFVER